ncbi:unnamed protein product [Rotaria magnacalcarata]|nr:unnamed protein product [Rotaria magnacalcarata]CAF4005583.1 unnamed protein product [Rotaria magnacalcarata]CAF4054160.1 unnamed protein product [Rotaria magnacalcarata]
MTALLLFDFLITALSQQINTQQIPFDTIVIFGDSHSDTGNVYKLTDQIWPRPPYFQGRFSNGLIWVDKLGVSNIMNYAYGAATTDNSLVQSIAWSQVLPTPGVRQQISTYVKDSNIITSNLNRTLFIIWVGSNDFAYNRTINPSLVVASLSNAISDLLKSNIKHVIVFNLIPIHLMPNIHALNQESYYSAMVLQFNNNLSNEIASMQATNPYISLRIFDIHSLVSKIINNPIMYAFNNNEDVCWNASIDNIVILCRDPKSYIFIDEYHFTSRMHEFFADAIRQFISSSSSPSSFRTSGIFEFILIFLCWMHCYHYNF